MEGTSSEITKWLAGMSQMEQKRTNRGVFKGLLPSHRQQYGPVYIYNYIYNYIYTEDGTKNRNERKANVRYMNFCIYF